MKDELIERLMECHKELSRLLYEEVDRVGSGITEKEIVKRFGVIDRVSGVIINELECGK